MNLAHSLLIICCMQTAWAHEQAATDAKKLLGEQQRDAFAKLRKARRADFFTVLAQNPCLKHKRTQSTHTVIFTCIEKFSTPENPYPEQAIARVRADGVDIDQQDFLGRTTLAHLARGHWEEYSPNAPLTRGLLKDKADPTLQDDSGRNAFSYAYGSDYADKQALLLSAHPTMAHVVNQPMLLHGWQTTCLPVIIGNRGSGYGTEMQAKVIKNCLKAGAHVSPDDLISAAEKAQWCSAFFKRCSPELYGKALALAQEKNESQTVRAVIQNALRYKNRYDMKNGILKDSFPKPVYRYIKEYLSDETLKWHPYEQGAA